MIHLYFPFMLFTVYCSRENFYNLYLTAMDIKNNFFNSGISLLGQIINQFLYILQLKTTSVNQKAVKAKNRKIMKSIKQNRITLQNNKS